MYFLKQKQCYYAQISDNRVVGIDVDLCNTHLDRLGLSWLIPPAHLKDQDTE